jgi:DNA-binding GntR family transcriptional regulator
LRSLAKLQADKKTLVDLTRIVLPDGVIEAYTRPLIAKNSYIRLYINSFHFIENNYSDDHLMARTTDHTPLQQTAGETLASMVYHRLLEDILKGHLEPGRKLRLQALKEQYDVGNSPLREALNRLSANGMVVREENKGFRVSPASAAELTELVRTRCWLEEIALRESIRNGDAAWEEDVVLAYHRLSRAPRPTDEDSFNESTEWENFHRQYHLALISACQSSLLLGYCTQLSEQALRYRNLTPVIHYRERHETNEHEAIRDAALSRNADLAVELLIAHFEVTADIAMSSGTLR